MTLIRRNLLLVASLVAIAVLFGGKWSTVGAASPQRQNSQEKIETLTGIIGDSMCGINHPTAHFQQDHGEAARACVKSCLRDMGAEYALVVQGKIYVLRGKIAGIEELVARKARVTGRVSGSIIQVTSFEPGD